MSTNKFTEDNYEQTLISLFKELGYQYECGYDVERDYRQPYHAQDLRVGEFCRLSRVKTSFSLHSLLKNFAI